MFGRDGKEVAIVQIVVREGARTAHRIGFLSVLKPVVEEDRVSAGKGCRQGAEAGSPDAHSRYFRPAILGQLLGNGVHGVTLLLGRPRTAGGGAESPANANGSAKGGALVAVAKIILGADGNVQASGTELHGRVAGTLAAVPKSGIQLAARREAKRVMENMLPCTEEGEAKRFGYE